MGRWADGQTGQKGETDLHSFESLYTGTSIGVQTFRYSVAGNL